MTLNRNKCHANLFTTGIVENVNAVVEKIFRQVLVHENNQQYQLILWRFDPLGPIFVCKLNSLVFSYAPSSYKAIYSIKWILFSYEAICKQIDIRELLARGCFDFSKRLSNHLDVLIGMSENAVAMDSKTLNDANLNI